MLLYLTKYVNKYRCASMQRRAERESIACACLSPSPNDSSRRSPFLSLCNTLCKTAAKQSFLQQTAKAANKRARRSVFVCPIIFYVSNRNFSWRWSSIINGVCF